MLLANRCSLIAMAAPSISLEAPTTNWASFTVPLSLPVADVFPVSPRLKSRCTTEPPVTTTVAVSTSRPVKKARTLATPTGTLRRRYWPVESVRTTSAVPSMVIRAFSRNSPLRVLRTRPSIVPLAVVWAEAAEGRARLAISRTMRMNRRSGAGWGQAAGVSIKRSGSGFTGGRRMSAFTAPRESACRKGPG